MVAIVIIVKVNLKSMDCTRRVVLKSTFKTSQCFFCVFQSCIGNLGVCTSINGVFAHLTYLLMEVLVSICQSESQFNYSSAKIISLTHDTEVKCAFDVEYPKYEYFLVFMHRFRYKLRAVGN